MTRFERKLNGEFGACWKEIAEETIEHIRKDLETGKISIDEKGIARTQDGWPVTGGKLEAVAYVTDRVDVEGTRNAWGERIEESRRKYSWRIGPATGNHKDISRR